MKRLLLISSLLFISFSLPVANAKQGTLKQCQKVHDKIERYTRLRRAGGSAKKMERLKRRRQDYEDRFSDYNCRRWRNRLD